VAAVLPLRSQTFGADSASEEAVMWTLRGAALEGRPPLAELDQNALRSAACELLEENYGLRCSLEEQLTRTIRNDEQQYQATAQSQKLDPEDKLSLLSHIIETQHSMLKEQHEQSIALWNYLKAAGVAIEQENGEDSSKKAKECMAKASALIHKDGDEKFATDRSNVQKSVVTMNEEASRKTERPLIIQTPFKMEKMGNYTSPTLSFLSFGSEQAPFLGSEPIRETGIMRITVSIMPCAITNLPAQVHLDVHGTHTVRSVKRRLVKEGAAWGFYDGPTEQGVENARLLFCGSPLKPEVSLQAQGVSNGSVLRLMLARSGPTRGRLRSSRCYEATAPRGLLMNPCAGAWVPLDARTAPKDFFNTSSTMR